MGESDNLIGTGISAAVGLTVLGVTAKIARGIVKPKKGERRRR